LFETDRVSIEIRLIGGGMAVAEAGSVAGTQHQPSNATNLEPDPTFCVSLNVLESYNGYCVG